MGYVISDVPDDTFSIMRLLATTLRRSEDENVVAFDTFRWYGAHISVTVDAEQQSVTFAMNGEEPTRVGEIVTATHLIVKRLRDGADVRQ